MDSNSLVVLTGDINFIDTCWAKMSSTKDYEELILHQFIENNLSNVAPSQLDVFLCNNPEIVLSCTYDRLLFKNFSINNKPGSDHFPICTQINFLLDSPLIQASYKFAYNNTDWKEFNNNLTIDPFIPFCYSNVDFLLEQFYAWLRNKIREKIQLVTKHRAILQPWISNGTSHMINKLNTKKRVEKPNLSFKLKIKKLEVEFIKRLIMISQFMNPKFLKADSSAKYKNIFHQFAKIHKYIL